MRYSLQEWELLSIRHLSPPVPVTNRTRSRHSRRAQALHCSRRPVGRSRHQRQEATRLHGFPAEQAGGHPRDARARPPPSGSSGPPHSSIRTPASVQTGLILRTRLLPPALGSGLVPLPAWNSLHPQACHASAHQLTSPSTLSLSRNPSLTQSHVDSICSLKKKKQKNCSTELAVCADITCLFF